MTVTLAYSPNRNPGAPYDVPRLTRAEIEALIAGHPASANPQTPAIIDRIVTINNALSIIEGRREPGTKPTEVEILDIEARKAPLARLYRQLGLYPVTN
jgi:hypothetical protein